MNKDVTYCCHGRPSRVKKLRSDYTRHAIRSFQETIPSQSSCLLQHACGVLIYDSEDVSSSNETSNEKTEKLDYPNSRDFETLTRPASFKTRYRFWFLFKVRITDNLCYQPNQRIVRMLWSACPMGNRGGLVIGSQVKIIGRMSNFLL